MKAKLTALKNYLKKCDLVLLAIALVLSAIGVVAIYSATRYLPKVSNPNKLIIVQCGAIVIGVAAFFIASLIDLDRFGDLWPAAYVLNLVMLLSLKFLGEGGESTGNNSWIRFAGIGIQPAEIGKLIFIFTFARHIYVLRDRLDSLAALIQLSVHALVTIGFIYIFSGDMGMCVVYLIIFVFMLFASGIPMKLFIPFCLLGCGAAVPLWMFGLKTYHKDRILVLFNPDVNPKIAYNGLQSMIAVGAGQLFGCGYMKGSQTQYGILPAKHTDFIFASICEEWGFIGGVTVIAVLTLLVWRVLYNASQSYDRFSYLLCIGVGGMLMAQVLINVGMCLGIMPVIGITLPLTSYGGTSVVTTFAALGIISGIHSRQRPDRLR